MVDSTPTFVPTVRLFLGGVWVQIVGDTAKDVLARSGLRIVRGRADWSDRIQPSRATMLVKNPTGVYSPRNPASPYFGQLNRNIPITISMDGRPRFHGEVSEWPLRADPDMHVALEAGGVLRRLSAPDPEPLRSVLYRTIMLEGNLQLPVAYWPCEEGSDAKRLYAAITRNKPIRIDPLVRLASFSDFDASAPIPTLNNRSVYADIAPHTNATTMTAFCLVHLPDDSVAANDTPIMTCNTTGSARYWRVRANINRTLNLQVAAGDGTVIGTTANTSFTVAAEGAMILLELTTSGADVTWELRVLNVGRTAASMTSGTVAGRSYNRINRLTFGSNLNIGDTAVGHLGLFTDTVDDDVLLDALTGHAGETAGRRVERLCDEETVPFTSTGDLDESMRMGPQGLKSLIDLLTECAEADGGLLYEPVEMPVGDLPGLGYRTRLSLYNTTPTLTLDFDEGQVGLPFEPTDDDELLANDVTVSRADGGSFRTQITTGTLSTTAVGRRRSSGTVNVEVDEDAEQVAAWRAHLGTWDETRIPQLTVSLTRHPALADDACDVDLGHRISLLNPPDWLPPDTIELMAQGYTEDLDSKTWRIVFNTTPWRAFQVVRLDGGPVKKIRAYDSALNADINSSVTTFQVKSLSGRYLWATSSVQMPISIRIDAELLSVTAISGATSPQTFTVVRGVNGYPADHDVNAVVQVADRATLGL
jgi:hypothetical protein